MRLLPVLALQLACFLPIPGLARSAQQSESNQPFVTDHGAVVRGDLSRKQIALVFTGGDYGEGTAAVLDTLSKLQVRAGLFVTGGFLRQPGQAELMRRALREGHYVGPHSNQHLLYCSWDDREKSLVTEQQFKQDLQKNVDDLRALGARPTVFIPPYEWFNQQHVRWAADMALRMFNFSPGSGSNRDYVPEGERGFVPSQTILQGILDYEKKDPHGLNGYILLLHLGADRKDKMYLLLEPLVRELHRRGYEFVRIDRMV